MLRSATSDIAALRRTLSSAQALAQRYAIHAPMPASTSQSTLVDKLALPVLPLPDSLTSKLATLGVNPSAAQRIGVSLSQAAVRLRDSCVADFELRRDALRTRAQYFQDPKSLSLISSAYSTIYAKTIREWTSYLLDDVTPRVLRAHKAHSPSMSKRLFNQNAVPMLEAFFSHNAFPSRLEKHELASQCAMEYRQIHVWFQNRRSRFRKEGKELKRPVGTSSVLESLEKAVVDVLLPPDQGDEGGDDNDMLSTTTLDFLRLIQDDTPPAHAFPSLYPPLCSYEPFPTTSEKRALRTPWMRRPQSTIHTAGQAVDVTQLTSALARLSIADGEEMTATTTIQCRLTRPSSSLPSFTPCSQAPHPALVRRHRRPSRTTRVSQGSLQSLLCDPSSHVPASRGFCGQRPRVGSIFPCPYSAPHTKCTLPRRIPKHAPIRAPPSNRRISPRSTSRTPSLASLSSTTSASESDLDSPVYSPCHSPISLHAELCLVESKQDLLDAAFPPLDTFLWDLSSQLTEAAIRTGPSSLVNDTLNESFL